MRQIGASIALHMEFEVVLQTWYGHDDAWLASLKDACICKLELLSQLTLIELKPRYQILPVELNCRRKVAGRNRDSKETAGC